MQPLDAFPAAQRQRVRRVLFDIDDTVTDDGRLNPEAFAAMARLQAAGLTVVPITGRPAGWCDHIARMWPVDAVVGENGAFYFLYDRDRRTLARRFFLSAAERAENRRRLDALARKVLAAVPGAALSADQPYREADIAIDYCEDVAPLSHAAVDRIVQLMTEAGATAKVSSIHVNGWFGAYDKLTMTRLLFRERFAVDLEAEKESFVFVGDSPNDAPMFAFFPFAVGVANIARFIDRLSATPAFVTRHAGGAGFAEVATALLEARAGLAQRTA
jgi:HAD superfamily hydrolase (TIGR01484 family)